MGGYPPCTIAALGTVSAIAAAEEWHSSEAAGTQIPADQCHCFTVDSLTYEPLTETTVALVNSPAIRGKTVQNRRTQGRLKSLAK